MPAPLLAVLNVGMVSGVGLTAPECCAAIRCGMNNFQETPFASAGGAPLVGSTVELEKPCWGIAKLATMAARVIAECLAGLPDTDQQQVPVLISVAEPDRPGRFEALAQVLLHDIEHELGIRLHPHSRVIEQGRVGGAVALLQARRMLTEQTCARAIVAGADSFLTAATLTAYDRDDRLLRRDNSNGFIPGEAAAAALLAIPGDDVAAPLVLGGIGFAREPAPFGSGKPLRADGLVQAIRGALEEAGIALKDCDHRIADVNGEQYRFKEAALAITRLLRDRKVRFSLWHPGDCTGEIGAATLPVMLAMLFAGAAKNYLPGPVFLGHLGNDDEKRAAFVARATTPQTLALEAESEAAFTAARRGSL